MSVRTFGLNSREFYEAVTPAPEPRVWAGGLPREPRWSRLAPGVWVSADDDEAAGSGGPRLVGPCGDGKPWRSIRRRAAFRKRDIVDSQVPGRVLLFPAARGGLWREVICWCRW